MTAAALTPAAADEVLVTVFARLFENEFATLDGIVISVRAEDGLRYLDDTVALGRMLGDPDEEGFKPADPASHALHRALHAASPDIDTVVSGWSRHLRALLLEGMALPAPTSMMRKRGIADLAPHLVTPDALLGSRLPESIASAQETADRNGMKHVLLFTNQGLVVAAGSGPYEVMAHWHNVEFAARVECLRVEEADLLRSASHAGQDGPADA